MTSFRQLLAPRRARPAADAPAANQAPPPLVPAALPILDVYVQSPPSDQNAVDLFRGEWSSLFPPSHQALLAGAAALFQDSKMEWAIDRLGGVRGQSVLELGPLEGGHTYMLDRAGAGSVLAIESNTRAFLKCLIAKEILGMPSARFRCGDFVGHLQQSADRYDLITASGVLYHMKDPLRLLQLLAARSDRVYIWTHYFDEALLADKPHVRRRFIGSAPAKVAGHEVELHRQNYGTPILNQKQYCGGGQDYSLWLTRDGLLSTMAHLGFGRQEVAWEEPHHPNGPSLAMIASKS